MRSCSTSRTPSRRPAKGEARDADRAVGRAQAADADRARIVVRINDAQVERASPTTCACCATPRIASVMLPKAESAAQVQAVRAAVPACARAGADRKRARRRERRSRWPAPKASPAWSSARSTTRSTSTSTSRQSPDGLAHAASVLAIASRVAGLSAPVAGVTPQLDDEHAPAGRPARGRAATASAPSCASTRARSRRSTPRSRPARKPSTGRGACCAAEAASPGAAQLDGRMIDRPVVLQAQRTLHRAGA